jgi:hypothetical protein
MMQNPNCGKKLFIVIIKLIPLISFVAMKAMIPPSGKGFYELLKHPKWTINGKLAMVRKLGYDGINGLCRCFLHRQDTGWSRSRVPVLRWFCKLRTTKHTIVYPLQSTL